MSDQPRHSASSLRAERASLLARYDTGALPPGIYAVLKKIDAEIAELELNANDPHRSPL